MQDDAQRCRQCGTTRDPRAPSALAWARERDPDGRGHWLCPACARRHVRDIEAKLPHEWWT
ncbi:hypothetical protein ACU61A_07675 [Pseudonocardia sichuanensis]